MKLTKEEFKVMLMLYVANADGNIKSEEVRVMLEKTDFDTVARVEELFANMNDAQALNCIDENKALYAATEDNRLALIKDMVEVIEADKKCTAMEEQIVRALRMALA